MSDQEITILDHNSQETFTLPADTLSVHVPRHLFNKEEGVWVDLKNRRVHFTNKDGIPCWEPAGFIGLSEWLPNEECLVMGGEDELDNDGRQRFWLSTVLSGGVR